MLYVVGALLILGLVGSGFGYYQGRSDGKAIAERELIAAQRDQMAELQTRLDTERREKAQQNAKFLALPDVRNRLCAVQGPASGCCRPEPLECNP